MCWKGRSVPVPRGAMIYYLKCVVSNNKKNMNHAKKQESMTHALEKKQAKKLSETPDSFFKVAVIDVFTEIKELTIEVVKEDMVTMSHQIRVSIKK